MKILVSLMVFVSLSSCSSLRKSVVYGSLGGASLGAMAGSSLSPDSYSKTPNALIWGGLGTLIGAGLGWFFYQDDPENKELPSMIRPESRKKEVDHYSAPIIIPEISKKYKIESSPLPDYLKNKVPNPYVIEHVIPEQIQKLDNGRSITVEEHKAWEISFEQ